MQNAPPMSEELYRDFLYPLNVFMHVLTHEEGDVRYLHYGLFAHEEENIVVAQERSTAMALERLPSPPARVLEVGIGLATTLARLVSMGFRAVGITPDEKQIAMARARHGETIPLQCVAFESFRSDEPFDCLLFQESSQYIESSALWSRARELTSHVVVLDEFAVRAAETPLHPLETFVAAAERNGFRKTEDLDLSAQAAPTVSYFIRRLPKYRQKLIADIGVTSEQVDELIRSGDSYRELYRSGVYGYRLMQFRRDG